MKKIVTIGEAVYDILFKDKNPVASKVGGSMLNVAVSLARAGVTVEFCGALANDSIGEEMLRFLEKSNVGKSYLKQIDSAKSNLALAFLNEESVPDYSFYRDQKLNGIDFQLNLKDVTILVVGSFYSIRPENFNVISRIVQDAADSNTMVVYDPNVRNKELYKDKELLKRVEFYFKNADIVKASAEDMMRITGSDDETKWDRLFNSCHVKRYILTNGPKDVIVKLSGEQINMQVPEVDVKSTVGAGDAFTAGLVSYLYLTGKRNLDLQSFMKSVAMGITFASNVCSSYENYIDESLSKLING